MREKIKALIGQKVEFFDDASGSLLDVRANYRPDWWSQAKLRMLGAGKKAFEVVDVEMNERAQHRYERVKEVNGTEIIFI